MTKSSKGSEHCPRRFPSLRDVFVAVPPAITLLSQLSLIFTLGPVGEWLRDMWLPITRALWERVGQALHLNIPVDLYDYLTAIVFFLPALIWPPGKLDDGPRHKIVKERRILALSAALVMLYLLAHDALPSLISIINQGFEKLAYVLLDLFPTLVFGMLLCVGIIVPFALLIEAGTLIARKGKGLRKIPFCPPMSRQKIGLHALVAVVTAGATTAFVWWKLALWIENGTTISDLMRLSSALSLIVIAIAGHALMNSLTHAHTEDERRINRLRGDLFQSQERERARLGDVTKPEDKWIVGMWVVLNIGALMLGVVSIGWVAGILLLVLVAIMIAAALRTPGRLLAISGTVVVLLLSAGVVVVFNRLRLLIETLP